MNRIALIILLLAAGTVTATADEIDRQRAHYNYMLFCQGCHLPDGSGGASVPDMKGHLGEFLQLPEGREFLVRVPGSANSVLNDDQLAELLNWMILEFGEDSIPDDFYRYTAAEVGELREEPLMEVVDYRRRLIQRLSNRQKQGP